MFQPIQPNLNKLNKSVSYKEYDASFAYKTFIACYWELKSTEQLKEDYLYKAVSDGCIDILWDVQNPAHLFITGFSKNYSEFLLRKNFHIRGIRFYPAAIKLLFKLDANEITGSLFKLADVLPILANTFQEIIAAEKSSWEKIEQGLSRYLLSAKELDSRLAEAMSIIYSNKGHINLESDLKDVGLSPRQLRRLFQYYIGESPKIFCSVVRFQNYLQSNLTVKPNSFYDFGYYDQAHFIKEFKTMSGSTPSFVRFLQ